jgi:hypothetical protein
MEFSDRTKILLVLVVVLLVLYFYNNNKSDPIKNEGSLTYNSRGRNEEIFTDDLDNTESESEQVNTEEKSRQEENNLLKRMHSKNSSGEGYKKVSYRDGRRGGKSDSLDKFFEDGTQFSGDNGSFKPNDDGDSGLAPYVPGKRKRRGGEEDKFNAGEFLPKEANNDWFEDVHAVSVKNRHLINIYRPIGVNTVSSTLKNPSLDLRGAPANPKTFVSPFNNSSIEPDHNIKGLC